MTASPLSGRDLAAVLAPFGESMGLPRAAYTSKDVFSWEVGTFWHAGWFCVARSANLVGPGQARAIAINGESVLLCRDLDGRLGAFSNVCRHRGHELAPLGEAFDARFIRCPCCFDEVTNRFRRAGAEQPPLPGINLLRPD